MLRRRAEIDSNREEQREQSKAEQREERNCRLESRGATEKGGLLLRRRAEIDSNREEQREQSKAEQREKSRAERGEKLHTREQMSN